MTVASHNRNTWMGALLVVALAMCCGCGPVTTASMIDDAERELAEARGLDATKNAPYEYHKADRFLHKAKQLQGYGLYEQSSTFARRSRLMAERAVDVARLAKDRQTRQNKFGSKVKRRAPGFTPSSE